MHANGVLVSYRRWLARFSSFQDTEITQTQSISENLPLLPKYPTDLFLEMLPPASHLVELRRQF